MKGLKVNLIGCIDELHSLVGDGEEDGRDLPHLFRRPLGGHNNRADQKGEHAQCHVFCSPRMEPQIVAYPHFGASILRGVGSPQFLNEHGTQVLNRERAEKKPQGCCVY